MGDVLLDLFRKGTHAERLRACRMTLEVIPDEPRIADIRRRFDGLLSARLDPPELVREITDLRRDMFAVLEGPGQMAYPFRLFSLLTNLWLADTSDRLYECGEWIDEFLDLEKVDTSELLHELPRARPV